MNIGIISYTESRNPGAQLQAYALEQTILKNKKVDKCEHITHRPFKAKIVDRSSSFMGLLKAIYYIATYSKRKWCVKRYLEFQKDYLKMTGLCDTQEKLESLNSSYDRFITGSDQVWNCAKGLYKPFFLNFVKDNKKKFAYAASMGIENVPEKYKEEFQNAVDGFEKISARELSICKLLENEFNQEQIAEVTDPVFLLKNEEWKKLISNKPLIDEGYVFVYCTQANPLLKEVLRQLSKTGKKIVCTRPILGLKCKVVLDMGPLEFLNYEYYADMIVTNSFHALCFGIIFHKNLYSVSHSTRGIRTENLMNNLKIDRKVEKVSDTNKPAIDYVLAQKEIDIRRERSIKFIEDIIEGV